MNAYFNDLWAYVRLVRVGDMPSCRPSYGSLIDIPFNCALQGLWTLRPSIESCGTSRGRNAYLCRVLCGGALVCLCESEFAHALGCVVVVCLRVSELARALGCVVVVCLCACVCLNLRTHLVVLWACAELRIPLSGGRMRGWRTWGNITRASRRRPTLRAFAAQDGRFGYLPAFLRAPQICLTVGWLMCLCGISPPTYLRTYRVSLYVYIFHRSILYPC